MATGTRLMQEINDQFLHCKICFENFRDPKTLSCLHTFCCACLQQHYDQEALSRTSRFSIYNRQVTCPLCRKKTELPTGGVRRLPDNFLVSNLTEVLAKRTVSKVPPCEICSSVRSKNVDACSKCLDCTKLLCKSCVDLHLSTKVTQQHSLIDLEGEKDIQCKVHPEENVRFYCEPCEACICVVCAFQEHRDHEVCSFNDGSAKHRSSLEALLEKCKSRVDDVSTRLNAIDKYETVVKDVKERIRDLAISYIAQVRAKERELMKSIEDEYGGEIKDFVDQKQALQENLDELQSTCNLTDIMLKDKGVELLLIKKDIEGKMNQLLEPTLPEMPSDPKYDVRFVPGEVALGCLAFGNDDVMKEAEKKDVEQIVNKMKINERSKQIGCLSFSNSNEPDVITNTTQTDKCRTNETSTSMRSDMRDGVSEANSLTQANSVSSRDTSTGEVETQERGVFAKVHDMRARGTMTERSDVRSLKCQTDQVRFADAAGTSPATNSTCGNQLLPIPSGGEKTASMTSKECGQSAVTPVTRDAEVASTVGERARRRADAAVDLYQSNSRRDCAPAPDLLPTSAGISAYTYTPGRKIRSIKIQTEISTLDVDTVAASTDMEFVNTMIQAQAAAERARQEKEITSTASRLRERPRRVRTVDAGVMTIYDVKIVPETTDKETSPENVQCRDVGVHVICDSTTIDTQTPSVQCDDSSTLTDREEKMEKCTSTQAIEVSEKETTTPQITVESKVTWTERLQTSDRATCTVGTKTQDRAIATLAVKTVEMGSQIKPYVNAIPTNTPSVTSADHECQTNIETDDQGTGPDAIIEAKYTKKETAVAALDSSVDFITPPQSPTRSAVQTCDRASDAIKIPCSSKATETVKVKSVNSSTETPTVKLLDKDTATIQTKTIDQWTETFTPQLVNTGVTPPVPATLDVGVATNVVLTDEQATITDMKAYRDSHTETVIVTCDNETLTENKEFSDAQTAVEIQTENQECETDKVDNTEEGSMTDYYNPWEAVDTDTQSTQCETPILRTRETNTTRLRRKAKEIQTNFSPAPCSSCGYVKPEEGQAEMTSTQASPNALACGSQLGVSSKEFKDSSTMPHPLDTQDAGTMAISCVTCHHDVQETAIQTSQPKLYDKSSATSFDLDQDFLVRALSREYQDAATSTESLPYIGLLSEIDVDELIVVPEAAFELVSDTDSEYDLIMVDDETSTDFVQYVEAGTQTYIPAEDASGNLSDSSCSMTESTGSKGVGEIIRSLVQKDGVKPASSQEGPESKHLVSIGVNTIPKTTFEKETCTPIRHLFSKGTMTFYVSKMDKSTSTLNQARIITGSSLHKTKSVDKITMTPKAEHKDIGVETDSTTMDGKITECISKLRNVSERLNSPPAKKGSDSNSFFGDNFGTPRIRTDSSDLTSSSMSTSGTSSSDKPEVERQRQLKTLLEQTNALLKPKDRSPIRKPQPITTLKGRKPASVKPNTQGVGNTSSNTLKPDDISYDSKSLPRGFSSDRPGTVRMGSQPLPPSRLPLLRYNSAPGRIATVPTQTLLQKSGQTTPKLGRSVSPRISPSKIPITKKLSPPEYVVRQQPQAGEVKPQETPGTPKPQLRRPLPSITETRTPSSCSDTSTASCISAGSSASAGPSVSSNRLSTDSAGPSAASKRLSADSTTTSSPTTPSSVSARLSVDSFTTAPSRSPSTTTTLSVNSDSLSDNVFRKSSTDTTHSTGSTETLEDKSASDDKSSSSTKKSGMGFMQRLLNRKKKAPEQKKEPVNVIKSGPPTATAVAALATAVPPLPTPAPESHAHTHLQHPPHHYPPPPEPKEPQPPRKPRPFVYVQQRIMPIQQDNVEEMVEKKLHSQKSLEEQEQAAAAAATPSATGAPTAATATAKPATSSTSGQKTKEPEKAGEKSKEKEKSKKESRADKDKEKQKKEDKTKAKVTKTKAKKPEEKSQASGGGKR